MSKRRIISGAGSSDGLLRAALSYSTRKPNGPRSVLVGGGIVFVVNLFGLSSVLDAPLTYAGLLGILPWVVLRGYYVRVVRTALGWDRPTPPPFDDIGRLFRNGLVSLLISACYLLPAAVVLAPLAYGRALAETRRRCSRRSACRRRWLTPRCL